LKVGKNFAKKGNLNVIEEKASHGLQNEKRPDCTEMEPAHIKRKKGKKRRENF
jgi:hypothetical protein